MLGDSLTEVFKLRRNRLRNQKIRREHGPADTKYVKTAGFDVQACCTWLPFSSGNGLSEHHPAWLKQSKTLQNSSRNQPGPFDFDDETCL